MRLARTRTFKSRPIISGGWVTAHAKRFPQYISLYVLRLELPLQRERELERTSNRNETFISGLRYKRWSKPRAAPHCLSPFFMQRLREICSYRARALRRHYVILHRRCDTTVSSYRNILIRMNMMTLWRSLSSPAFSRNAELSHYGDIRALDRKSDGDVRLYRIAFLITKFHLF